MNGGDGNFYGAEQGIYIFRLSPTGVLTTLINTMNYPPLAVPGTCTVATGSAIGAPDAPFILGVNGNMYGTTFNGGTFSTPCGSTIFEFTTDGQFTPLYQFPYENGALAGGH